MVRPVPEYIKVRSFVYKLAMHAGEGGERLPSENELRTMFNVSRVTVREALQDLHRKKIIMTKKGMGTFVHPDFKAQGFLSCCIGYLRYGGNNSLNQITGVFADCIDTLGFSYELLFYPDSPAQERQFMEILRTLSGVVWEEPGENLHSGLAEKIAAAGIPLLVITKTRTPYDTILQDAEQEGEAIASCAETNGHKNVLFISSFGNLPFEEYIRVNPTYSEACRRIHGENFPKDAYCSPSQFRELVREGNFLKRYSMLYSRRTYVREVMECLREQGIRVPQDISYLVFEQTTPHLFGGLVPACIECGGSLKEHLLNWMERRIIRKEKEGVFFEKSIAVPVHGESVADLRRLHVKQNGRSR